MQNFKYYSVHSLEEALNYLSENAGGCSIIAGGTDLIPALRNEDVHPGHVINILEIGVLKDIVEINDTVRIGSTVTFSEVVESEIINRYFPLLAQASLSVGSLLIRNRGTVGGNIVNASPASDFLPAVVALEGELELQSKTSGKRLLPVVETIDEPYKTHIKPDEILTAVIIKKLPKGTRCSFEKLAYRNANARARMNMSILLCLDGQGVISGINIVPGAVMPVAKRVQRAEKILFGKKPEVSLIEEASEVLADEMEDVWDAEYKIPVLKNVFKRVLDRSIQKEE